MSITQIYGDKQEKDVIFHLRRSFKDRKNIFVFHDVRLLWDGENAQIDHLVLHKFGFIVIESKSILGEVRVNEHREWSRSYQGSWYGLPSPIQQAENQTKILKKVLQHNAPSLLGKVLGLQGGFGLRRYDVLIAVSSSAIIHRDNMPENISRLIVKSEFIPEQVDKIIKGHGGLLSTNPAFSKEELSAIKALLTSHQTAGQNIAEEISSVDTKISATPDLSVAAIVVNPANRIEEWRACCKHCDNIQGLEGRSGKFGYFVACPNCKKNTPLKRSCPRCQGETKLKKDRFLFTVHCAACGEVGKIVVG